MRGIGAIAGLSSGGLIVGTLVPGAAFVLLGVVYLLQGNTSAAPMNISHLLPQWTGIASLVLIVNNFLSYAGMEVNAVHVNDLRNPGKEYPKAMFLASALVVVIFVLPAPRRGRSSSTDACFWPRSSPCGSTAPTSWPSSATS